MSHVRSLTYVEVDVEQWSQSSPDSPPFEVTYRFAVDADYLPSTIDCIPSIKDVKITPAIVGLGSDLGQRASIAVTFKDHRHVFGGESFTSGTFWGKWRARFGLTLRGHPLRLIRGTLGQSLSAMETRYFTIESSDGPNAVGEYKIIAKDVLKFADADRSQAPILSNGFLASNITNVATSATLSPTGIGNSEYPVGGSSPAVDYVAIGGKEICAFSRSGDTLTLTRGQFNTEAVAHSAQDRVQLCKYYSGQDAADIIHDLLTTYSGVDPDYITLSEWQTETGAYLGVNFTALIAEPTGVDKLISELIEQSSLAVWWDDINQKIRLQVLRAVAGATTIDMETLMRESLEISEQPDKRLSQVYVYFGKINPLVKEDQINNYRSTALRQDTSAEAEYGTAAIKKIFSRWIAAGGRTTAELIANKHLGRFRDPPRRFNFDLLRHAGTDPQLGAGYFLESWQLQDTTGAADSVPIQVFRLNPGADRWEIEAEEMLWTPYGGDIDPNTRNIIFDANENNVNLRTRHDQLYPEPESGNIVNATITENTIIGSSSTSLRAFDVGTWPGGVTINLTVIGRIQGAGGTGGNGGTSSGGGVGNPGGAGGIALYTRQAINLTSTSGEIWGGGGGGGGGASNVGFGGGGGGGAGTVFGNGGLRGGSGGSPQAQDGAAGTSEAGGAGGSPGVLSGAGGNGGNPGNAGSNGGIGGGGQAGGSGGAAGAAIDGDSFVTDIGAAGDIRGGQIN